jgi:hypothetical protein
MKSFTNRALLILFIPLMPLALLIDLVSGDCISGVKCTSKTKFNENISQFTDIWNNKNEFLV